MPQTCSVCNSQIKPAIVAQLDALAVYECPECRAESVHPLPTDAESSRAYDDFDAGRLARQDFDQYVTCAEQVLREAIASAAEDSIASPYNAKDFLDYGCGGGHFVRAAQKLGLNAVGIELDPVSVQLARERGLDVRLGRLPGPDVLHGKLFHYVLSFHVLEHVTRPYETFHALVNHVQPNGRIFIGVPDQTAFPSRVKKLLRLFGLKRNEWGYVQPPIHLHGFTPETLEVLGKKLRLGLRAIRHVSPLDAASFPSTSEYWRRLPAHRLLYSFARLLRSPGYLFATYEK